MLRTPGRFERVEEFGKIVVANQGGAPIRVSDVAEVSDTEEEARTSAFLDGERAVVIDVRRQSGQNTIARHRGHQGGLERVRPRLPPDLTMVYTRDDSLFIYAVDCFARRTSDPRQSPGEPRRPALHPQRAGHDHQRAGHPRVADRDLHADAGMDFTLNTMTLLGLTLAVGIVIDDAIVVLENIFRKIDEGRAARRSARRLRAPAKCCSRWRRRRSRWS